jgi:hypothetical protein
MDWRDLERMVKEERKAGNPVASTIHSLQVRGLVSRLALDHPPPTSVRSHPHQPHTHEHAASYARLFQGGWAAGRLQGLLPHGRGRPTLHGRVRCGVGSARWRGTCALALASSARTHARGQPFARKPPGMGGGVRERGSEGASAPAPNANCQPLAPNHQTRQLDANRVTLLLSNYLDEDESGEGDGGDYDEALTRAATKARFRPQGLCYLFTCVSTVLGVWFDRFEF